MGTQLGPYRILEPLGAGGMGEVYRAEDVRLERQVALKVLPRQFADDPDRLARFEREAKAVAALAHPNILILYDVGNESGVHFAVTELLEGQDLRRVGERGALPWRRVVEVGAELADALESAHTRGVIHRDLKPGNIFLTRDGRVKILDFGLARLETKSPPNAETTPYASAQTQTGIAMGTVGYMAPEQLRGQAVDARVDIFSLGCVLYEMAAGSRPFQGETPADTSAAVLHDDPPAIAGSGKLVPFELEQAIRKCLAKRREDRFQSAQQLAAALRAIPEGSDGGQLLSDTKPSGKPTARRSRKTVDSIAVLPLVNLSADPKMEYLGDGITETIINTLSRFPKLRVMARSTVFRYKGREQDAQEIGRALNVRAVLTGRVLERAGRLTISTELVDVRDGSRLWGEQYTRDAAEIFAVEEAIAQAIVDKLRLRGADDKRPVTKEYTRNTQAYQHYLKGRFHWNKRIEIDLRKAIGHFEQAIQHDPNFALAYAGLADSHGILPAWTDSAPEESFPTAKRMAVKALELDDTLAEAHTSLGYIYLAYEWNWSESEREYRRAIELNPSYANAHHWYAYLLMLECRFDEARSEIERAQELDPLSLSISANVGYRLYFARQFDLALEQLDKTLALDDEFPSAHHHRALIFEQQGKFEQAVAEFRHVLSRIGTAPSDFGSLGHIYASWGKRAEAQKVLDELLALAKARHVPSYQIALIHLKLGDIAQAFQWLERGYRQRDFYLVYLKVDPRLDSIRTDPRFIDLYRRVGLSE